jgi:hypothetical protein
MIEKIKVVSYNIYYRIKLSFHYNVAFFVLRLIGPSYAIFDMLSAVAGCRRMFENGKKECNDNTITGSDFNCMVSMFKSYEKRLVTLYEKRKCIY